VKITGRCYCGKVRYRASEALPDADEGLADIRSGLRHVVDLRDAKAAA